MTHETDEGEPKQSDPNLIAPVERPISDEADGELPRSGEALELDLLDEFEEGAPSEEERIFKTIVLATSRMAGAGPAVL
jgi:hypothetical protein